VTRSTTSCDGGRRHNRRNSLLSISKLADWDKDEPMGAIGTNYKIIYGHRELPPFGADAVDVIEAPATAFQELSCIAMNCGTRAMKNR
jgi:hypothetical protein